MQEDLVSTAIIFHKRLNPKIWRKGKLDPMVRYKLLKIAKNFINYISINNLGLKDITLSGSNAGYTFSKASDLDLHLLVSFDPKRKNLMRQFFDAKKNQFNFNYNITIKGISVELYVQDIEQPHTSAGIYSVLDNKWLQIPNSQKDTINRLEVKDKYKHYVGKIRLSLRSDNIASIKKVFDDIKNMRKHGLETGGELSVENITFKVLRAKGLIEKLRNHISKLEADSMSLETQDENL
jgi:hypothetical protein